MFQEKKILATGLLILTILIVIYLASGISGVEFQPGNIISEEKEETEMVPFKIPGFSNPSWFYLLMCVIWVAMPIAVIFIIKYPEVRRKICQGLTYVAIYGLILFLLSCKIREDSPELEEIENELIDTTIIDRQREASEFISSVAGTDPNLDIILDIVILILVGILVWYIYQRFFYKRPSTAELIKAEVEGVINKIKSGVDLRNVIIRCYVDMCQILVDQRGIQRKHAMTPREFEFELEEIGLPQTAVHRLTHLFEEVRYGNAQLDSEAEQEAIHCLTAITNAC